MLPQPGASFGRYDVTDLIGRGGMGVVYRAEHRDLGRPVALKLLSPELSDDPAYRARFLREARTLARLDTPHVVRVHDAGDQDGVLFIATELVPDGDLAGLLSSGGLAAGAACAIVRQVAEGLSAAHRAGILHRDIKPSNVLLDHHSGGVRAVLCDFGISTEVDIDSTQTAGVIGTPRYMAPERHEGADASVASDVYSLGCLLWACVTGRPPYDGTAAQIVLGHLHGEIPRLTERSRQDAALNALLSRLMAKSPSDRPGSAGEVAAAMMALTSGPEADTVIPPPRASSAPSTTAHLEDVTLFGEATTALAGRAAATTVLSPTASPRNTLFTGEDMIRIEAEIARVRATHDVSVSIYFGPAPAPVAATARRLHASLPGAARSVLVLIEPDRRVFEIVVGSALGDTFTGPATRRLALALQTDFRARRFGAGLLGTVRAVGRAVGGYS